MQEYIVHESAASLRLLDYLIQFVPAVLSRNGAKKAIKSGRILLNGNSAEGSRFVNTGDKVSFLPPEPVSQKIFELKLQVVYEDDFLAVINKPAGIGVSGNYFRTIENALPFNLKKSAHTDALEKPRAVHRLDNQTSGLLLIAKTASARIHLGNQFEQKSVHKTYFAIVAGALTVKGNINFPIGSKEAFTEYEVIQQIDSVKYQKISLVKLIPYTGRTHQLRIHLSSLGHPILGDKLYTKGLPVLKGKGLFLAALELSFTHPVSNQKLSFSLELPHKFSAFLIKEQGRYKTGEKPNE
ncbi:MAG: RNA pseudouridine synthase [Bacteroidetes bacterium HGW-Bacteroidetes-4]|jgi:RluA family pseudouridine synthase|nr:MAG: RNA pseudouridine synthase [Bacteroidetes bacterium HGW-Bacteroidetes-4]